MTSRIEVVDRVQDLKYEMFSINGWKSEWHFSDHFHFHPTLEQKRVIDLRPCHIMRSHLWLAGDLAEYHTFLQFFFFLNPSLQFYTFCGIDSVPQPPTLMQ